MKQLTLAIAVDQCAGFGAQRKPTRREAFLDEMNTIGRGRNCVRWWSRFFRNAAMAARQLRWSACCRLILCSTGSALPTFMRRSAVRQPQPVSFRWH